MNKIQQVLTYIGNVQVWDEPNFGFQVVLGRKWGLDFVFNHDRDLNLGFRLFKIKNTAVVGFSIDIFYWTYNFMFGKVYRSDLNEQDYYAN